MFMASSYKSTYSKICDKQITPAQKIVELICERFYGKDNISLPKAFWNDPRYARNYRLQLIKANALLKMYSAEAILAALLSSKGKSIYSLTAKWLDPLIATEEKKIQLNQEKKREYESQLEIDSKESLYVPGEFHDPLIPLVKKKSLLDKLDG